MARIFLMSTFNLYHADLSAPDNCLEETKRATNNALRLAKELVDRSVGASTSRDLVALKLKEYAEEAVGSFGVSVVDFKDTINIVCDSVAESYDFLLRPFVLHVLGQHTEL